MLVTSSIISVAMSQFLSRNLASLPLRVAAQPVRSSRTWNVTGCPDSQEVFHPLFKPHCYAPLETLLTTFARPTSTADFSIRNSLSGPSRFEGGLFRKWLESSQGREKEIAGRILDCFARLYYRWSFLPFEISPYCDINTGCPRNHGTKKINREKNDSLSESRNKRKIN